MNLKLQTNACDPEQLELFLSGALSDAEEREFTLHLNSCENCRDALQQQAAEPEAWSEAEKLLRPAEFDAPDGDDVSESATLKQSRQPLQIQNVLAALGPTDDPEMLGRLGGYEVSGVVGEGGMGVVLKAIDKSLDRTVAIKVLAPHLATSGAARKRFAREAKAAAAVLHPNVIAIHSVSNDESLPYLVMPYVRGTSLQKRLDKEGPLSLQEILRIGSQIAAGLAAAHAQGLVHRDIKPANILLEDGVERVTITDFGLARAVDDASITHSGVIAGTPQFMSPEQARGEAVDGRSDLFSLGSVLYAICTGRPPFRAETSYGVMRRITDDEPTPIREINPEIPAWLCQIITRLMSKPAADRFASATEVSELLEKCLAHVQQPATVPLPQSCLSLRESSTPFAERKGTKFNRVFSISRRSLGVIAMIATFVFAVLGIVGWQATEPPDISGKWSGPDWGHVALEQKEPGEYEGTYTDTFKQQPGKIQMKWSRLEGRYKGTWQEGKDRRGKISVRLVEGEIRGAWTTSEKSGINPGNPELADLLWKRSSGKERPELPNTRLPREVKSDKDLLQGFWTLQESYSEGKKVGDDDPRSFWLHELWIHDNEYTELFTFNGKRNGGQTGGTLLLDQIQKPKQITIVLFGSERRGIYKLEGESLTICWAEVENGSDGKIAIRPDDFRTTAGSKRMLHVYQRAPAPVQLRIAAPEKMLVTEANYRGQFDNAPRHNVPVTLNLTPGETYRLKLSEFPGRPGLELFPTLEVRRTNPQGTEVLKPRAIPLELTAEDLDLVAARGSNTFYKVAVVNKRTSALQILVSCRPDALKTASQSGSILYILRIGNTDLEADKATDKKDGTVGIRVRLLLSAVTHSSEVMNNNKGFGGLSIMGTGVTGVVDGKPTSSLIAVMAHECRLESFREAEYRGQKYWDAEFFVPRGPMSDGSNRSLSQKMLDGMKEQGVEFQLDHYRDQASPTLKSRDHDKELQSTSNNPPRTLGDQALNVIESLQVFDANQPPVRHLLPIGNVSKVSSEQGQVEVSLMKPGSVKVGDVLELSRPNPLRPGSYTRFARVRVVEVQKSDEAIIAVMTHSAREKVENRWEWRMPEAGDYVCLLVLKSEAEIPKPILEPEPKSKNSLPKLESESELQKFQGTWVLVSSEKDGEEKSEAKNPYVLTFLGTKWKVHRGDEVAVEGTLQLVDVISTPRKFDLHKPRGLGPVPTVDYGIYEWKDDTLRYCVRNGPAGIGLPGMMDASELRPKEFATRDGDGRILYIWQRTGEGKVPGTVDSSSKEELCFSETKEFVLSMDSLKFMLDLDTGKTMDPPATIRPGQEQMDVQTDQVQPYHYPTKLTGRGLQGVEVKASDWDASAAEVRRALMGKGVEALKEMDLGPEKNPTYFFKTRDGTLGVLQLLELVEKPKGIRLRYKTVVQRSEPPSPPENEGGAIQKLIDGLLARSTAIKSGRIEYHLKIEIAGRIERDSDYRFSFSGESWATRYPKSTHARVNHDGRLISYWTTPQKDGSVTKTLTVELPESAYKNHPYPPVRAGTFWESTTTRFVRDRAGKARLLAAESVNGVETQVLEWDVAAADAFEAFYAVNALSQGGGKLRVYVAPQLGYVLPRIEHVDRFGSVQSIFDSSDFKEVASKIYFPMKCVCNSGSYINAYDVKLIEKCNDPIPDEEFLVSIPTGTSVADSRPKSKDTVGPDGKRMTSYEVYPYRHFHTGAAYPKGFPAELLKELDRDVMMPKRVHRFPTTEKVKTIAISPDGKLIAIANGDVSFPVAEGWKRSVEILDAETGKAVVSLQLTTKEEDAILAATEGLPHVEVGPIAFLPSENVVAVGTGMGQVKIFNARTGELLQSLDDEKAKLAEKTTPEKLKSLKRAMGGVGSLAFSPDGSLLAMTGSSFEDVARNWGGVRRLGRLATGPGRLKVWEVKTGTLKHDLAGHSHAEAVSFSADGTLLASAGRWGGDRDNGNGVLIWNTQTGQKVNTILQEANSGTHAVVFSPTKKLVAIGSRHYDKESDTYKASVVLANAVSGIVEWTQMLPGSMEPKGFSPDGKNVLALWGGESIRSIDTESGQIKQDIKCVGFLPAAPRQGSQWIDFAISPTGPTLAIGGVDKERKGSVEIWDLNGLGAAQSAPAKEGEKKDGKQGTNE